MSTDKLWTVISGIEYQLNILKDKLNTLDEETNQSTDEAYQRGLEDGKKAFDLLDAERDSEYQRGLDDAWECAKKLFSTMSDTEIEKVFPTEWENGFHGLMQMKPQYAIEKLKAYEEKQKADDKIKVGDEVKPSYSDIAGVVTLVDGDTIYVLWRDGSSTSIIKLKDLCKTGRHFDILSILEDMRK